MIIAIDIDDTLAEFSPMFIKYYNNLKNTSYNLADFTKTEWWKIIKIKERDILSTVLNFYDSEEFDAIEPVKGAVEALKKLSGKHELICVSARSKKIKEKTENWISKYFEKSISNVFITDLHMLKNGAINKATICKEQKAKLLIDDLPKFNDECNQSGIKTLLFDKPWNQNIDNSEFLIRVKSWPEIMGIVA